MLRILYLCYLNITFITPLLPKPLKVLFTICFSLLALAAQSQASLSEFLRTSNHEGLSINAVNTLNDFIQLTVDHNKDDRKTLRKIFQKIQSKYLKSYVAYSSFDEVFTSGHYDCLTATALFSYVLDRTGYSFDIIETNYHIFLMVHLPSGEVLLETTDRFGGFVEDAGAIAERTGGYRRMIPTPSLKGSYQYKYSFDLYQLIDTRQITGLLFFNQAVKAFNNHDWMTSSVMLEKAIQLYPSPRCEALGSLLTRTLLEARVNDPRLEEYLGILQAIVPTTPAVYAAN